MNEKQREELERWDKIVKAQREALKEMGLEGEEIERAIGPVLSWREHVKEEAAERRES